MSGSLAAQHSAKQQDYQAGEFEALVPPPRPAEARTPEQVLVLAAALKRENPERTAAQVRRILVTQSGWSPSDGTLQRLFERLELNRSSAGQGQQQVFGRFEASRPNELWTGWLVDRACWGRTQGRCGLLAQTRSAGVEGRDRARVPIRIKSNGG